MAAPAALILGARRSAVVPVGGAFADLAPHELGAPLLRSLLARAAVPAAAVDLVLIGNALGAGGNPARLLALAAGLPERCAALSLDSQCDAGLDAVTLAASLITSGQAEVVIAGGVEAWSRAPLRAERPPLRALRPAAADEPPRFYERPAFAPEPARDPDLLAAASAWAAALGLDRAAQDTWAVDSHRRAVAAQAELAAEIEPIAGVDVDTHPRPISAARAARLPLAQRIAHERLAAPGEPPPTTIANDSATHAPGLLALAPRADGAALLLLASETAARRLGVTPIARWIAGALRGHAPEQPMAAALPALHEALRRAGTAPAALAAIELHDAFAVQGLHALHELGALGLDAQRLNRRGGGLARGHPIGASGAIALVRVLADLQREGRPGDRAAATIAAAGGLGAAAVVERL